MIKRGIIVSKKELFDGVISYHNTLIIYLPGLLTLLNILALIHIRGVSKDQIHEQVEKSFKSDLFEYQLEKEVGRVKNDIENEYVNFQEQIENLKNHNILTQNERLNRIEESMEIFENQKDFMPEKLKRGQRGDSKKTKKESSN